MWEVRSWSAYLMSHLNFLKFLRVAWIICWCHIVKFLSHVIKIDLKFSKITSEQRPRASFFLLSIAVCRLDFCFSVLFVSWESYVISKKVIHCLCKCNSRSVFSIKLPDVIMKTLNMYLPKRICMVIPLFLYDQKDKKFYIAFVNQAHVKCT